MRTKFNPFDTVWGHINNNKFQDALTRLDTISPKRDEWFYAQARCFQGLRKYQEALKSLASISRKSKASQICLARCYQGLGKNEEAIETFHSLSGWDKDKNILLTLMYCYEEIGKYEDTIRVFHLIPSGDKDKQSLISLARCYEKMGKYEDALVSFHKISNWAKDKTTLLGLARCYQKMGKYEDAIQTFHKISKWDEDKQTLLGLARCKEEMGHYVDAISTFHLVLGWDKEKQALIGLARCYQEMGNYDDAIKTYYSISSWEEDKLTLLGLARCYQEMGKYDDSLRTFSSILNRYNDKHTLIGLARCYEKMAKYEDAIRAFQDISGWNKDKQCLLDLARCYEEMGMFDDALKMYHDISGWNKDKQTLLSLARCYEEMGKFKDSLETLHNIPNWEKDKQTLLGLARCYQKMGKYNEATKSFYSISNWDKDKLTLLGLACCYEDMEWHKKAWSFYQKVITQFPCYQDAAYQICNYALKQAHPDAKILLADAMKKWPYCNRLYLLKAQYQSQQKDFKAAHHTLIQAIQLFPYFTDGYLALIRNYLIRDQLENAESLVNHCIERFKGNHKLFSRMHKLVKEKFIIRHWGENFCLGENNKRLVLPQSIQNVFALLSGVPGECYLVGSTIHLLLNNKPLDTYQDVDVVIFMGVNQFDVNQLRSLGFVQCPYNPQLFTARSGQFKVDCYIASISSESIHSNALSRDFSIGCLYCDKEGNVLDPSGHGLSDLQNKTLRTVMPPTLCFQEDPVRLLRAIKCIITGYRPTPDVQEAMKNWIPDSLDLPHLYAVARKHLSSFEQALKLQYVQLLQDYGLIQKIFGLTEREDPDLTLGHLKTLLGMGYVHNETNSSFTFFKHYPQLNKGLTHCAIEKARLLRPVGEYDAYLNTRLQYFPHLEALDLAKLKSKEKHFDTMPAPSL